MTDSYLTSIWEKAKSGVQVEGTNLDLKREWWNFNTQLEEFLKDTCLMANNHSGESYIIIGMDEDGILHNAPVPEDEANIQSRHKSRIEPIIALRIEEFTLNGSIISVLTIPHSTNRPHVVKRFGNRDNWIPIKVGSSTLTASRADLDEMYKERSASNSPSLRVEWTENKVRWANFAGYGDNSFGVKLTLDNSKGSAPGYITKVTIKELSGEHWESQFFKFDGSKKLNDEYKIEAFDRKTGVNFYVSDLPPRSLRENRSMPDVDRDQLKLILQTLNDEIVLDIKPGWLELG